VALDTAQEGAARRDLTITDLVRGRARDSSQIASAESVIGRLERAARGCRVPLVGLRCPVGAIGTIGSLRVDEEKCIGCFSCVEFCPRGAFEAPAGQAQAIMSKVFR